MKNRTVGFIKAVIKDPLGYAAYLRGFAFYCRYCWHFRVREIYSTKYGSICYYCIHTDHDKLDEELKKIKPVMISEEKKREIIMNALKKKVAESQEIQFMETERR